MVTYFYNRLLKKQLVPVGINNRYFAETNFVFSAKAIAKDKQFIEATFLFYSLLSFYTWTRFIINQKLFLLVVIEHAYSNICRLLLYKNKKFSIISETVWIPGILSNTHEIKNGTRYILNIEQRNMQLKKNPDFMYLCATTRLLVSQEATKQLTPQFAILLSVTNEVSAYFIPLFIPKWSTRFYKIKYNQESISTYNLKVVSIEKYLFMAHFQKSINHLIYLNLLRTIS